MLVRQSPNQSLRRWLYVLQSVVCDEIGRLHTIAIATRTQLIASSTQADGHNIIRLASLIYSCLHSLVHFSLSFTAVTDLLSMNTHSTCAL